MGEREKEIRTDWSSILQERSGRGSGARLPAVAPLGSYDGMLVRALLSEDECIAFVRATEATGYGSTDYAQTFRGNLRLMTHDSALASKLFLRLRPHLPETLLLDPESNAAAGHVRPPGVWRLAGLNEKFRFAKYRPGDEFQPHVDAKFVRGQEQSAFSVNVYLNADFYGGATRFFGEMVWWPEGKRPVAENLAVDLSVQPECGAACIFRQPVDSCRGPSILHDGQRVTRGFKYLLRTDVLYRREEVSASFHALEDIVTDIPRPTPCAVTPTSSGLSVVFDIDGTLIDSHDTTIYKRPHVDALLDWCFANCAGVALWTLAGEGWANRVVQELKDPRTGEPRPWVFVWSGNRASQALSERSGLDWYRSSRQEKRLSKVWGARARREQHGFTRERTLIVEDTESNCVCNYGNAIYVPTYDRDEEAEEQHPCSSILLGLQEYLARLRMRDPRCSVRAIEKRGWFGEVAGCLMLRKSPVIDIVS